MKRKIIIIASAIAALALATLVYFKFYFVFGEGVKAGDLNFVVYKGYVFKTYEGHVIQAGFGKGKGTNAGSIQSYEFDFSITDQAVADSLMRCAGKTVERITRNTSAPSRGEENRNTLSTESSQ